MKPINTLSDLIFAVLYSAILAKVEAIETKQIVICTLLMSIYLLLLRKYVSEKQNK
jgi:hypothetical protein